MVLDGDAGAVSTMQKRMLSQAFISSQRMVFLIADLLNVSRLKTGKFMIEKSKVNLANIIGEEIEQLQETVAGRAQTLSYEKPADFPTLMLDETKTRQVVMNFVDNAIHYTPPGGHIRIELKDKEHVIELKVIDDGIGVPKSDQHHLFTKFYRAPNARRERPDGTGLGLFMAKKVIVAQGGAVLFESKENKGSTFGFTLPKAKLLVKPEPKPPARPAEKPAVKSIKVR
jgi:signal transduction histidine kinase